MVLPNPENQPNPDDCLQHCGLINDLTRHIHTDSALLEELFNLSLSETPKHAHPIVLMALRHLGIDPDVRPAEFPDTDIGDSSFDAYNELSEHTQNLERMRDTMVERCKGPLGLRAIVDNTRYTVLVCRSSLTPRGTITEPTVITRKDIE